LNKFADGVPLRLTDTATRALVAVRPTAARSVAAMTCDETRVRVLLVEDNAITQLVTIQQLRELGCIPQTASSGTAALEAIRDQRFDLVLLDCRLPDIDGYETARRIRKLEESHDWQPSTIIAITGDSDIACVDKCLSAGMDGHLPKPTNTTALRLLLERFLT
jgi:CheY-like chemotaxis protein